MARRANRRPRALRTLAVLAVAGCSGSPSQPEPTNLANEASLVDPPRRPEKTGRFGDPNADAPGPRDPQIAAPQIEAALAEAHAHITKGELAQAIPALQRCANKSPISARCDGELGIVLAELGTQKPRMRYFLAAAAAANDPAADAALYRRIAQAARKRGHASARAAAMATLEARGEATAADLYVRAQALSADPATIPDAVVAMERAVAKDPAQHAWLLEWAVLTAQTDDTAAAIARFEHYLATAPADAPQRTAAQQRIAALKAKRPPQPSSPAPAPAPSPATAPTPAPAPQPTANND